MAAREGAGSRMGRPVPDGSAVTPGQGFYPRPSAGRGANLSRNVVSGLGAANCTGWIGYAGRGDVRFLYAGCKKETPWLEF